MGFFVFLTPEGNKMVVNRVFGNNDETSWKGEVEGTGTDWILMRFHGKRYRVEFPSQGRYLYFQDEDRETLQSILNMLELDEKIVIKETEEKSLTR